MDVRQLRYFVEIVDLKSMSKAAERLHVAQPALSQQIASLEVDLGNLLLNRSTRGVEVTAAGATLYRHARSILRQLDQARRDVNDEGGEISGTVAVGMPTSTAAVIGMPLVQAIHREYPRIHLQLFESVSGYLGELLATGRLDFSVLFRSSDIRDVLVEPLLTEELFFVGHLPGADDSLATVPLPLLASVPLALPSATQELRDLIERTFAGEGVKLNVIADVDSLPSILAIAIEGFAGTILPHSALSLLSSNRDAVPCRSLMPTLRRPVSVCRLKSTTLTPAADIVYRRLFDLAADAIASDRWRGAVLSGVARLSD